MSIRLMSWLKMLCVVAVLAPSMEVEGVTINFDTVADGTAIDTAYSSLGVTFNNPLGGASIYARSSSLAQSLPNVVSVFSTGFPEFDARYGAVEATFSSAQSFVSIDAAIIRVPVGLGTPTNFPKLEVYNTSGGFITAVNWNFTLGPQPPAGGGTDYQTLAYSSASANIGKVRVLSGQPGGNPSNFGRFDNLKFGTGNPAAAGPIGVQFTGGGGVALAAGQTAGLIPQSNYNVVPGVSGSGLVLKDNSGVVTTASLSFTTNESGYVTNLSSDPVTPDEILNDGILNGTLGTNPTITITGIPHALYDLIVYTLDTEIRNQRVTATTGAGSTSFTVRSPNGDAPGYQDSNAGTPYTYLQGTTNSQTPVPGSDYVRFSNLTGNVTIHADAQISTFPSNTNNNVFINGFQIVPEPRVTLMLLFAVPLVAYLGGRKRTIANR